MNVTEMYQSIHGELPWIGKPCTIIRFAGCNLECSYCDAPTEEGTEYTVEALVEACKLTGNEHVLLTGGEPMLQQDLELLVKRLRYNYHVTIETNGTKPLCPYADTNVMDVKLFKDKWDQEFLNLKSLRPGDAIKFVYEDEAQLTKAIYFVETRCSHAPYMIVFSPVNPKESFMLRIIELSKRMKDLDIRLQVQIHRVLEVG